MKYRVLSVGSGSYTESDNFNLDLQTRFYEPPRNRVGRRQVGEVTGKRNL